MAIDGLNSHRVERSLRALESYLGLAVHLADGVKASETLKLELESGAGPHLKRVVWKNSTEKDRRVIRKKDVGTPTVIVTGDYLTRRDADGQLVLDVKKLELVGAKGHYESTTFLVTNEGEFEAVLTPKHGSVEIGSYEALVIREDGQRAEQKDACSIAPDKSTTTP